MKKRILSMLFATTMLISLVGCGTTEENPSNAPTEETADKKTDKFVTEVETVEITIDNWQEYFEVKEAYMLFKNGFDEYDQIHMGYAITLKNEYLDKIVTDKADYPTKGTFEVKHNCEFRNVMIDKTKGTFEIGEEIYLEDISEGRIGETRVISINDYRNSILEGQNSFKTDVAAIYCDGTTHEYQGIELKTIYKDIETIRAEGVLYFYE